MSSTQNPNACKQFLNIQTEPVKFQQQKTIWSIVRLTLDLIKSSINFLYSQEIMSWYDPFWMRGYGYIFLVACTCWFVCQSVGKPSVVWLMSNYVSTRKCWFWGHKVRARSRSELGQGQWNLDIKYCPPNFHYQIVKAYIYCSY